MANLIYVSYRRENGAGEAGLIAKCLRDRGYRTFLDVDDLRAGRFDSQLRRHLARASDVVVILAGDALGRCTQENDWLAFEIRAAIQNGKCLIPVLVENFQFPSSLPAGVDQLPLYQAVRLRYEHREASLAKLCRMLTAKKGKKRRS